jgi:UDP-N-acetylglucosamine 1-carboxyvinyltransferase
MAVVWFFLHSCPSKAQGDSVDKLVIDGGVPLTGAIAISGSKNAALPILFASILLTEPVCFRNVPNLRDIHTTLKLLNMLGCVCEYQKERTTVRPGDLLPEAPYDLVRTMRASVLCLGPLLARIGRARVALPGGCAIGARPVDQHLKGLELMGARFELEKGYILGRCRKLHGARITFDMPTVGGTENLLMAAALAEGETILENAAREPEVVDLANFLVACGARIEGQGTSRIQVTGVNGLRGVEYAVMPDRIEAGTFLVAAGITGGELLLRQCPVDELESVILKLRDMGMAVSAVPDGVLAKCAGPLRCADVTTKPYPGFPTDMQAQFMALMCLAEGAGVVEESIFENRFMHVPELVRMGGNIRISGHTAMVRGVRRLTGAPVMASDLRGSAALVLAGLASGGTTEVSRIYHLDRGYEKIEDKLAAVGARIRREKE